MHCPACREPLVVVERERIEIDWCLACRGLWFDEGELELLAERVGRRLESEDLGRARPAAEERRRRCPRCRRWMRKAAVGSHPRVTIDRCDDHGVWLDRGELGRILGQSEAVEPSDQGEIIRFLGETFRGDAGRTDAPPPPNDEEADR